MTLRFVPIVSFNITDIVRMGHDTVFVRLHHEDKQLVNEAAHLVGMKQVEFSRTVLVQAARKVIEDNAR